MNTPTATARDAMTPAAKQALENTRTALMMARRTNAKEFRMTSQANEVFFRTTGRHVVTLSYIHRPPGEKDFMISGVVSGFIMEIERIWFFVTAGHVIKWIQQSIAVGGGFDRWRLDDQTAGNPFKGAAIPIEFSVEDDWMVFHDDELGCDYAVLAIDEMYRKNLEAGGVRPITKKMWALHSDPGWKQWILMGVPGETVRRNDRGLDAKILMVPVTPAQPPQNAASVAQNRFFGKLQFDPQNPVSSQKIEGMSGGPIFATRKMDNGDLAYFIIGIQSGWYPDSQIISACPFVMLAEALESAIKKSFATAPD